MYRWNRTIKKAAAWALAAVLAGTYADVGAFSAIPAYAATEETAEKETILSFAALPEEIAAQEIAPGAEESEIRFPEELTVFLEAEKPAASGIETATVSNASGTKATASDAFYDAEEDELLDGELLDDVTPGEGEETTIPAEEWKLVKSKSSKESFSSETPGESFVYEPVISKDYRISSEASVPQITVMITAEGEVAANKAEVKKAEKAYPAFSAEETVDNVTVTVTAEEGAFPEGAKLIVEKAAAAEQEKAEAAVAEQRETNRSVAVSYTFDIRIEDEEGTELQPADGKQVKVAFSAAEAADENLSADIWHIKEDAGAAAADAPAAEKLAAETDAAAETVTAETDSFSLYTVEFTYKTLTYVIEGGAKVALADILTAVGLTGEVTAAEVSDSTLFEVSNEGGEWVVKSHRPFSTTEWMKVTVNGIVYEITVTDAVEVNSWAALQAAFNAGGDVELSGDVTASLSDNRLVVFDGKNVVLDLKGHTLSRNLDSKVTNGEVIIVAGKLTIKDTAGGGRITGGYGILGGGIYVGDTGELVLEGGTISGNHADNGGGVVAAYGGKFTMNGGTISDNEATEKGGGIFAQCELLSINGGSISNNKATVNGGGIWFYHDCNIQGNVSITGNKCGTADNNLYILAKETVKVTGALNSAASIGITTKTDPEAGSPFDFASAENSSWLDAEAFTSDKAEYSVGKNGDHLALFKPKSVTVSGITASDKAYDGTTGAALDFSTAVFSGKADGDELTVTGSGAFSDKNAGTGKTVNITGLTLGGADAGKYYLASTTASATADITPREVGLSWGSTSFVYDGNSHVPSATATGLVPSDSCDVTVSGAQKAAGSHTAKATGLSNSNYKLPSAKTKGFTIGKKKVTLSGIKVNHKIYDKSRDAEVDLSDAVINGKVSGDDLSLTGATGTFDNEKAGSGHAVTVSGYEFGGTDAGNYYAEGTTTVNGIIIERKPIGLSWGEADFTYNGLPQAPGVTATGLIGDDTCTVSVNVVGPGGDAGSYTAIASGVSNYNYAVPVTDFTKDYEIKKASLTVTTPDAEKVYDGTALTAAGTISGFVNSETATFTTTGTQTDVGSSENTYSITWDGTAKQPNYTVKEAKGTLKVTEYAGQIDVTTTGGTWTYDGLAHGATVDVTPLPAGYTLVNAASSASQTDVTTTPAPATADTLVIENASHVDVTGNLNIVKTDGSITINPAPVTVTTPDAEKVYDGTALTAAGTLSGLVNSETATLNTTGSQTKAGSSENTYGISWDGTAKESNYTVTDTTGTLTVNPKEVTVSGITAKDKKYDGRVDADLDYSGAVINGKVAGDDVSVTAAGTFERRNPGTTLRVDISGLALTGADAANYNLAASGNQTETTAAIIGVPTESGDDSDYDTSHDTGGVWNQNGNIWTYTYPGGNLAKGWNFLTYRGKSDWYFFDQNGIMQTGWIDWNGSRYYLFPISDGWRGRMLTGWQLIDGTWFFFEPVSGLNMGHLYTGTTTPDGYQVGADGAWRQ